MVERRAERQESEKRTGILVCNAIHEWSAPASHPHEERIYVCDWETGEDYSTQLSLTRVARWLKEGRASVGLFSAEGQKRPVFHNPPIRGFTTYCDGDFGRPLVPGAFFSLHPLRQDQLEEIEAALM